MVFKRRDYVSAAAPGIANSLEITGIGSGNDRVVKLADHGKIVEHRQASRLSHGGGIRGQKTTFK
jgi:hypothetical protein